MRPGDVFNPWHESCGFYPQDVVGRLRRLRNENGVEEVVKDGPKRAYERLVRYAGRDGECFPSQKTLAYELGKSDRQIRRDIDTLRRLRLNERRRGARNRSSRYLFLWHEAFEKHQTNTPSQDSVDRIYDKTLVSNQTPDDRTCTATQKTDPGTHDRPSKAIRPDIDDRMTGHVRPTKSSSKHQRKASESSGEDSRPRTRGKARQDSIDDDEKPKPEYASPKDELKAIYLSKAGKPIAVAVLDAIEANLVCIGVEMAAFVEEIRRHSGNDWRNPAGFLRDLSKKFRTKTRSSAAALTAAEAEERAYRCPKCGSRKRGEGALLDGGRVTPCGCASPEYIEHLRSRGLLQAAKTLNVPEVTSANIRTEAIEASPQGA